MRQIKTKLSALLLALALLASVTGAALAAPPALDSALEDSAAYVYRTVSAPKVGSVGGEWAVIGLARSGYAVPQSYWDDYYAAVEEYVRACNGVLHSKKYTEYSRVIVALTAIGADPTDVAGYDLTEALGDFDKTVWQGLNGPIWALIALDSGSYSIPVNASAATQATRQMYIDRILDCQLADGGWSLTGKGGDTTPADPDITGMALQALAKYQDQPAVAKAVGEALDCMSAQQGRDGGIYGGRPANVESCVQMLVALCELGIPLDDPRFVKDGSTLLDALLGFYLPGKGFQHTTEGSGNSQMSSEQGLYALAAARRAAEGQNSLYRMGDCAIRVTGVKPAGAGLPGKHADVKKLPITAPGLTFADVAGHPDQAAIEAMIARGVITGDGQGHFVPDAELDRAGFATIVVRTLGLEPKACSAFTDVPAREWYAPYIGTAYTYGLIGGDGQGHFFPAGTLTRQDAAVLVARAAKMCGMDTARSEAQVRDTLSQFGDYRTVANWAKADMAFCYDAGILDDNALNVEPERPILRCEIAQMLYHLLSSAKLL